MASIHKLKKRSDRRTALLGLAADRPVSAGVCLTPEEMAELVENQCPIERKEKYFRHVANCESCYREWLTLHEVLDQMSESKRESRIFKIFKPGKMALLGTFLAAAASVVVFLNINNTVMEKESLPVPAAPMRQEVSSPGQEQASPLDRALQAERKAEDNDGRTPVKPAMPTEALKQKMPVVHDAVRIERKKSVPPVPPATPPAPVTVPKEGTPAQQSFPTEQALPETSGEDVTQKAIRSRAGSGMAIPNKGQIGAAAFDQWREQLESGCAERRESEAFWLEIEQKGRQLMENSEELEGEEKEILKNLLFLTTGIEKKNAAERCRRISDLLAEERENR
jgi:hypothetical protein